MYGSRRSCGDLGVPSVPCCPVGQSRDGGAVAGGICFAIGSMGSGSEAATQLPRLLRETEDATPENEAVGRVETSSSGRGGVACRFTNLGGTRWCSSGGAIPFETLHGPLLRREWGGRGTPFDKNSTTGDVCSDDGLRKLCVVGCCSVGRARGMAGMSERDLNEHRGTGRLDKARSARRDSRLCTVSGGLATGGLGGSCRDSAPWSRLNAR